MEAGLLRALEDPDADVRTSAAETLSKRPLNDRVLAALVRALGNETTERVATALLDVVTLAASFDATARGALDRTARTHPLEAIRVRAHDALAQFER